MRVGLLRVFLTALAVIATACGNLPSAAGAPSRSATGGPTAVGALAPCGAYAAPDRNVGAEVQHLKTSAAVLEVTSACTVRVTIAGGAGTLYPFTGRAVILRAGGTTTFASAAAGDLGAIGRLGLKPGDVFTLSFDSRAYPDGSYPLNFMNR